MSGGRRMARSEFSLTREYPHAVGEVWSAFAEESRKRAWFCDSLDWETGEWRFDFRVGGTDVAEGAFHDGPVSRYVATYTDIVEHVRIVTTYDMWLDGVHMSTSLASFEFDEVAGGTRFTHTEHGVFFDEYWDDGAGREEGTRGLLEQLAAYLG